VSRARSSGGGTYSRAFRLAEAEVLDLPYGLVDQLGDTHIANPVG
jgi:hypothetical protein